MCEDDRLFEDRDVERLALEPALRAVVIPTYQVGERRNTWGGMFVYRAERCFVNLEAARAHVEAERKMGSNWRIRKLPACAFIGERESLIIADAEVEPRRPLAYHKYDAACRPYLASIAAAFELGLASRVRLLTQQTTFTEAMRFSEWESTTFGARYRLHWHRIIIGMRRAFDLSAIKSVINVHRNSLHSLAFWGLILSESAKGTRIQRLHARSPLVGSGIRPGDVVTQVANLTQDARGLSLETAISRGKPGDLISLRCHGKPDISFRLQSFEEALKSHRVTC